MTKKTKLKTPPRSRPSHWVISRDSIGDRSILPGQEFTAVDGLGKRVRCRFVETVDYGGGAWVTGIEVEKRTGAGMGWRSFRLDAVKTIHRKKTARR